ncbi:MAG: long-chain-fatty-acid--CoA ligase [Desulfomonile tiedjei]|nr:long-chain-fatty-acid--CoA ligase [Desulfomonile tiedjei]
MGVGNVLRRCAFNFPNKLALISKDRRITYADLNRRVNCVANSLVKMGLKKGDRVAVLLHNCPEFIELYFACAKSGGTFVPINNLLKQKEFLQIFEYIRPRFFIFDEEFIEIVQSNAAELKSIEFPIVLGGETTAFKQYGDLVDQGVPAEPSVTVSDDDLVSIFLTSGTTGRPKGAMRTHRHDTINIMSCALELGLRHEDRALLLFPFYHVTFADSLRHILMSNTIVIRREGGFDPRRVLNLLSTEGVTVCQFVPTMINAMLQEDSLEEFDLSRFRLLLYAASPMPVELLKKAMNRFKCQFFQLYGQTETGPCTTALAPEDHVLDGSEAQMARLASAGRPVLDYELRIVDEEGKDVAVGEVGEIIVRSEAMTVGYWELPEETARAIQDGWLYTGDFGKFDAAGYVFIVDRKHDMIISGGKNIYPREIEEVIYTHEAVLEAAVIGIPDDYWGESVKACIVLKDGMNATEEEIISLCKHTIASYKKPRSVEFMQRLPKSPTGKILKRMLREQYGNGGASRVTIGAI